MAMRIQFYFADKDGNRVNWATAEKIAARHFHVEPSSYGFCSTETCELAWFDVFMQTINSDWPTSTWDELAHAITKQYSYLPFEIIQRYVSLCYFFEMHSFSIELIRR